MKTLSKIASLLLLTTTLATASCSLDEKEEINPVPQRSQLANTTWVCEETHTLMSELDSSLYEVNDTHVLRFEDEKSGRMASRRTVTNSDGTLYVNTPFTFTLDNDHGDLTLDEGNHIIPCEFTYNANAQILTLYKFMVDGHPLVFKPREN